MAFTYPAGIYVSQVTTPAESLSDVHHISMEMFTGLPTWTFIGGQLVGRFMPSSDPPFQVSPSVSLRWILNLLRYSSGEILVMRLNRRRNELASA